MQETSTRSPALTVVTAAPTSTTVPTASWPRIVPGLTSGTSPLRVIRSVPTPRPVRERVPRIETEQTEKETSHEHHHRRRRRRLQGIRPRTRVRSRGGPPPWRGRQGRFGLARPCDRLRNRLGHGLDRP